MLNACIIGYGIIAPLHAKAINSLENGNIYGVCDIIKERADEGAKNHNAKAFYSYDDVLLDENIDVVHIATPHYLHADMAIKALKFGKHVVLEKPLTMLKEEFNNLLKVYKKSDKKVCAVFQNRMNKSVQMLKDIVEEDKSIGKLLAISGSVRWMKTREYYEHDAWRGKYATEGGGVLINQAIHTLDLVTYFGGEVDSVCASKSNKSFKDIIEVEDTVDAIIWFKSGAKASFYATTGYSVNQPVQLELNFENATFRYADNRLYKIANGECTYLCGDYAETPGKSYWGGGHKHVIYDFYNAIENGGEYIDIFDCQRAMNTMFAIYESAKNDSKKIEVQKSLN